MIIFLNILLSIVYWFSLLFLLKKLPINFIYKSIILILLFIGYIIIYYYLFDGCFNYYNYIIIIFTFFYMFIYK